MKSKKSLYRNCFHRLGEVRCTKISSMDIKKKGEVGLFTTACIDTRLQKSKHSQNVSKISVSLRCYRQIGSKSTNHSHQRDLLTFFTSCQRAVIGRLRSDLAITSMIDGNLGNVSSGVFISEVAYQWW